MDLRTIRSKRIRDRNTFYVSKSVVISHGPFGCPLNRNGWRDVRSHFRYRASGSLISASKVHLQRVASIMILLGCSIVGKCNDQH